MIKKLAEKIQTERFEKSGEHIGRYSIIGMICMGAGYLTGRLIS